MSNLVLIGLGIVAFFLFKKAFSGSGQRNMELEAQVSSEQRRLRRSAPQPQNLAQLTILDAQRGDVIAIRGAGADFEDLSFDIDRCHRYENGNQVWYELSGIASGKRVHLEVENDDDLRVTLNRGKRVYLDQIGLGEDDLRRLLRDPKSSFVVRCEGKPYRFEFGGDVMFFENNGDDGEEYQSWDFVCEDGTSTLFVEKWEEEPYEAGLCEIIEPTAITVLRK